MTADHTVGAGFNLSAPGGPVSLYFSTTGNTAVPGVPAPHDDGDIYTWDGSRFGRVFDASAAGLPTGANIDALKVVDGDTFYVSFKADNTNVPGLGLVQDEDVALYDAGTWSLYFDGTVAGLGESSGEDVDGFEILPDGSVLVSTLQPPLVPGVSGVQDEDLLRCVGSFGPGGTSCTWTLYLDGSAMGLATTTDEDVDDAKVSGGQIYLSTLGVFSVTGLSGTGDDVFVCNGPSGTPVTSCSSFALFFDGSALGLADNVDAFDVLVP
jgi:hypothetical protein